MVELKASCPSCHNRENNISVGDSFTAGNLYYHLRCDHCGLDFEARAPTMKIKVMEDEDA
jgi:transcription elongation factor Elf1